MEIISFIGRPCAGKGTQIELLKKKTGFPVMSTGEMLRERAKKDDVLGRKIKDAFQEGKLHPTPVVFSLWMPFFLETKESDAEGVIMDGNPRKLYEAWMLEELFEFLDWKDCWRVFYINIKEEDAYERMKKRAREHDSEEEIKSRLQWFNAEIVPVIDYFKEKGSLVEIDGEGTVEEVWERVKSNL